MKYLPAKILRHRLFFALNAQVTAPHDRHLFNSIFYGHVIEGAHVQLRAYRVFDFLLRY